MQDKAKFDRAVELAIQQGFFKNPTTADQARSEIYLGEEHNEDSDLIILKAYGGQELAELRVKNNQVVKGSAKIGRALSSQEGKAIAWAQSIGYPIPKKFNGCLSLILVVIGLTAAILPGILILAWLLVQENQYKRDMKALIEKWIDAGRPDPGQKTNNTTQLQQINEQTHESSDKSLEEELMNLKSMKENKLITEEEYQAMRKKALGL